mmetsp:Transcript_23305/g.54220  ORF Transcript_23305/g.54220 Transcript_23305/m.54220 type:complete len:207 (-) Transcript_23305:1092-1712(-)
MDVLVPKVSFSGRLKKLPPDFFTSRTDFSISSRPRCSANASRTCRIVEEVETVSVTWSAGFKACFTTSCTISPASDTSAGVEAADSGSVGAGGGGEGAGSEPPSFAMICALLLLALGLAAAFSWTSRPSFAPADAKEATTSASSLWLATTCSMVLTPWPSWSNPCSFSTLDCADSSSFCLASASSAAVPECLSSNSCRRFWNSSCE